MKVVGGLVGCLGSGLLFSIALRSKRSILQGYDGELGRVYAPLFRLHSQRWLVLSKCMGTFLMCRRIKLRAVASDVRVLVMHDA